MAFQFCHLVRGIISTAPKYSTKKAFPLIRAGEKTARPQCTVNGRVSAHWEQLGSILNKISQSEIGLNQGPLKTPGFHALSHGSQRNQRLRIRRTRKSVRRKRTCRGLWSSPCHKSSQVLVRRKRRSKIDTGDRLTCARGWLLRSHGKQPCSATSRKRWQSKSRRQMRLELTLQKRYREPLEQMKTCSSSNRIRRASSKKALGKWKA